MLRTDEILSTIQMLHAEHLDVRTVTLGLNLDDCAAPSVDHLCRKLRQKIVSRASRLVEVCDRVGAKYGIPVINKRLAISPAATLLAGHGHGGGRAGGQDARRRGRRVRRRFRGRLHRPGAQGHHPGRRGGHGLAARGALADQRGSAPRSTWPRAGRASTWTPSTRWATSCCRSPRPRPTARGFGCAKLVVFANIPEDNPFMAGAYLGAGEPEAAVNIGVSGPGVVCSALRRRLAMGEQAHAGRPGRGDQDHQLPRHAGGRADRPRGGRRAGRGLRHRRPLAGPHADGRRQRGRDPQDAGHRARSAPRARRPPWPCSTTR